MPPRPGVTGRAAAAWAVVAVLVGGCSSVGEPRPGTTAAAALDVDDRVEEVRGARAALAEDVPAALGASSALVAAVAETWLVDEAADRAGRVTRVTTEPATTAVVALDAVELPGEGPELEAVRAAVADLAAAIRAVVGASGGELDDLARLSVADEQLAAVPTRWDAPGSSSQQRDALTTLEEELRALADELGERRSSVACIAPWERRARAATTAADRSAALVAEVDRRDGAAFDALRASFRDDPFGLGGPIVAADARAADECWDDDSEVAAASRDVGAARVVLELALDPPSLGEER